MEREAPSRNVFVVHPRKAVGLDELKKCLDSVGSLEVMQGPEEVIVVRLKKPQGEPRSAWESVKEAVKGAVSVSPVLLDSSGLPHYPTGRINVRFSYSPEQAELKQFADTNELKLKGRNKFIPSQFVFEPRDPAACYLPDLLEQIRSQPSIVAAWADTLSSYQKV